MRICRLIVILGTTAFANGCYRYVETTRTAVSPGSEVRAQLTEAGVEEMRGYFGPDVQSVKGPLARWDEDGVEVLVQTYVRRPGFPPTSIADTIRLSPFQFSGVEIREVDRARSIGLAALIAGGTVAAVFGTGVFGGGSDDGSEGDDPDPDASIIFRIPIRISFD